jgi:8-oxo-dGTP pyrophosphatase MutT (NUDIX family)
MPPFASTSALVLQENRILVVVDPIRDEPILPGGHLKWRETPPEALVREVWEETGYLVEPGDLVAVLGGEEWVGEPGVVRVVYAARIIGGALKSSAEGEARWDDLDSLAGSTTRDAPIVRLWRQRGQDVSM